MQQQAMTAEAAAVAQAAAVSGHISAAPNVGRMTAPAFGEPWDHFLECNP